ncbi:MAG: hypothetical protein FJW23_12865 [Acidimicrobiia bacterium]|nr:hypothetical protein [Acidimicrobiia bacterium]
MVRPGVMGCGVPARGLAALVAVTLAAGCASAPPARELTSPRRAAVEDEVLETAFMCPMHPDVTQETPGMCPRCGMSLVVGTPFDMRNYLVHAHTTPERVQAGEPVTINLGVYHPGSGDLVKRFEVVHDRYYHFFVISQDLTFFEHLHPEQELDGTWSITVTLPKPGHYRLLSDFVPTGGTPQFVALPLTTAGYDGDLLADTATLVPDEVPKKTVGHLTASVSFDPTPLVSALHVHLTFQITRADTGEPVTDLQTYLGAFGHILMVSEDAVDYVHSHPVEMIPAGIDPETARGGPNIIFEGMLPRPGRYRAWAQFRHQEQVLTFPFTFEAVALGS